MPHTKTAKRRHRQSLENRFKNRGWKSAIKTQIRRVLAALASGDQTKTREEFRVASQRMDQAAAKGIIHPNMAARLKSRLSKRIKPAKAA